MRATFSDQTPTDTVHCTPTDAMRNAMTFNARQQEPRAFLRVLYQTFFRCWRFDNRSARPGIFGEATARNQRPDANDRMIDVVGELLAQRRADFVIIFAIKIIGGGESA
jgi:hypothetical protein